MEPEDPQGDLLSLALCLRWDAVIYATNGRLLMRGMP
jgi:hypothetical protein